ncbi:hypothetical protein GCM10017673_40170 [Streptosporangium violaceochromogenes]|nr:hypothetical protein GCM10017673_40170 [Streptosporangium violaceochromogenes]
MTATQTPAAAAPPHQGPAAGARSWTITLTAGTDLLNSNQRLHHRPKSVLTKALRKAGKEAAEKAAVPALTRAHMFGIYCPPDRRRRDPANLYPSFKALIDGVVDAGVLPDDDDRHLVGPDMRLGPAVRGGQLRLLIVELPPLEGTAGAAPRPPGLADVARLVAAEFDRHHACLKRRFAREVAQALEALAPPGDDPHARALRRGITLSIHTLLAQAGLPADTPAEVKP